MGRTPMAGGARCECIDKSHRTSAAAGCAITKPIVPARARFTELLRAGITAIHHERLSVFDRVGHLLELRRDESHPAGSFNCDPDPLRALHERLTLSFPCTECAAFGNEVWPTILAQAA